MCTASTACIQVSYSHPAICDRALLLAKASVSRHDRKRPCVRGDGVASPYSTPVVLRKFQEVRRLFVTVSLQFGAFCHTCVHLCGDMESYHTSLRVRGNQGAKPSCVL